ncbi:2-keto-4-pentenoate hydratase [Nocardioides sp. NPDC051685]|uniref:2-keto-4-pentenoate hydratase n=1 Tax=Nocardioides sp. NPDC051685 TaxID=3364334 RepID=UPI00379922D5
MSAVEDPGRDPGVVQAAERLRHAQTTGRPCPPIRHLIGSDAREAAYAVQHHVAALQQISGALLVGRKLGMMSPAVQAQLGVAEPTIGTLMDTMQVRHGGTVPVRRLLQPLVEAEIAFRLVADLDGPDIESEQVRAAVGEVYAALEVVDSRIAGWDISAVDTIADNASGGLFVLAPEGRALDDSDLRLLRMELRCWDRVVSTGSGADNCMGDPLQGLVWLAREAHRQGIPLRSGMLVLAGALGPMVPIHEGDSFVARIGDLPEVAVHFRSSVATRAAEASK